uniref:Uncharacterized protein n=1 Tax=Meloidogyne floridensis TaxID=298350 RepID=A0A915P9V7_9BILA
MYIQVENSKETILYRSNSKKANLEESKLKGTIQKGSTFSLKSLCNAGSSSNSSTDNIPKSNNLPQQNTISEERKVEIQKMLAEQRRQIAENPKRTQQLLKDTNPLKRKPSNTDGKDLIRDYT